MLSVVETMKLNDLIQTLQSFVEVNGDAELYMEYWCVDCKDYHEGNGLRPEVRADGRVELEIIRLGDV